MRKIELIELIEDGQRIKILVDGNPLMVKWSDEMTFPGLSINLNVLDEVAKNLKNELQNQQLDEEEILYIINKLVWKTPSP